MFRYLNDKNPLSVYKISNIKTEWREMSEKTGITVNSLIRISSFATVDDIIRTVKLDTYFKIKRNLGVDILNWGRPNPEAVHKRVKKLKKLAAIKKKKGEESRSFEAVDDISDPEEVNIDLKSLINNK